MSGIEITGGRFRFTPAHLAENAPILGRPSQAPDALAERRRMAARDARFLYLGTQIRSAQLDALRPDDCDPDVVDAEVYQESIPCAEGKRHEWHPVRTSTSRYANGMRGTYARTYTAETREGWAVSGENGSNHYRCAHCTASASVGSARLGGKAKHPRAYKAPKPRKADGYFFVSSRNGWAKIPNDRYSFQFQLRENVHPETAAKVRTSLGKLGVALDWAEVSRPVTLAEVAA